MKKSVQLGVYLGTDNKNDLVLVEMVQGLQTKCSSLDDERDPNPITFSQCEEVDAIPRFGDGHKYL